MYCFITTYSQRKWSTNVPCVHVTQQPCHVGWQDYPGTRTCIYIATYILGISVPITCIYGDLILL